MIRTVFISTLCSFHSASLSFLKYSTHHGKNKSFSFPINLLPQVLNWERDALPMSLLEALGELGTALTYWKPFPVKNHPAMIGKQWGLETVSQIMEKNVGQAPKFKKSYVSTVMVSKMCLTHLNKCLFILLYSLFISLSPLSAFEKSLKIF